MRTISEIKSDLVKPLHDEDVLWRYTSIETLFAYLQGKFFIPSLEKLRENDPFEANLRTTAAWFGKALRKLTGGEHQTIVEFIHNELTTDSQRQYLKNNVGSPANWSIYQALFFQWLCRTRFASCWFQSTTESALMWSSYGDEGVAVATTVGKLKNALSKSQYRFVYQRVIAMELSRFNAEKNLDYALRPFFFKRKEYEGEREVRFVTSGPDPRCAAGITLEVATKPDKWIKHIRLHPKMVATNADSVVQTIQTLARGIDCKKSDLITFGGPIKLSEEMLKPSLTAWLDDSDGIPHALKNP